MSENPVMDQPRPVLFTLLSSNTMADLLVLFRRNPGLIDTVEGIARRVGMKAQNITSNVSELENLAILQKKKVGKSEAYFLNRERDAEAQREVANYITSEGWKMKSQ